MPEDPEDQRPIPVGSSTEQPMAVETIAKRHERVDLAIAIGLALFGLGVIVMTATTIRPSTNRITYDPVGPRGVPFSAGVLCLVLGALLTVSLLRARTRETAVIAADDGAADLAGDDPRYPASAIQAFKIVLWTFVYAFVLTPLGYLIATPLHIAACLWTAKTRRRSLLVWFPIIYTIVTYGIFGPLLNVRIPLGPLEGLIEGLGL